MRRPPTPCRARVACVRRCHLRGCPPRRSRVSTRRQKKIIHGAKNLPKFSLSSLSHIISAPARCSRALYLRSRSIQGWRRAQQLEQMRQLLPPHPSVTRHVCSEPTARILRGARRCEKNERQEGRARQPRVHARDSAECRVRVCVCVFVFVWRGRDAANGLIKGGGR